MASHPEGQEDVSLEWTTSTCGAAERLRAQAGLESQLPGFGKSPNPLELPRLLLRNEGAKNTLPFGRLCD